MTGVDAMKKILLILADGFEEVEALGCADFLKRCGFEVTLAGMKRDTVTGAHGIRVIADLVLAEVKAQDFAALVLPGGMPGSVNLYNSDLVLETVKSFYQSGRIVAAICAAPMVLGRAGLLCNRKFTIYPGVEDGLNGAAPTGNAVESDGRIITGRGPGLTFKFAERIAVELGAGAEAKEVMRGMLLD